ncbi:MAG: DNA polymerase III subunit delta [Candidatus Porifericomitaceae bacterium WSBS_2022_MAG_OTU9]
MNNLKLPQWLKKHEPPPVWMVSGDEPLQLCESIDAIRAHAKEHGCDERVVLDAFERSFQWRELELQCSKLSLFSSKRLIEVRMGAKDPGVAGSTAIRKLLQGEKQGLVLLFSFDKNDNRTKQSAWYKAIAAAGEVVSLARVNATDLPRWLVGRAKTLGFDLHIDAADWIAGRTEGHLLAAAQELRLLAMLERDIVGLDDALHAVSDSARFNVFDLLQAAWQGNASRTFRMLFGLQDEGAEPVALLGALTWDLRRMCTLAAASGGQVPDRNLLMQNGIYGERQQAAITLLKRSNGIDGLYKILAAALQIEVVLKSGDKKRSWRSLAWLFMYICFPARQAFSE